MEHPAVALLLHVGVFVLVTATVSVSERTAPAPVATAERQRPAEPSTRTEAARLQADRYATGAFSSSLSLLPTLYELSGVPPELPPRSP